MSFLSRPALIQIGKKFVKSETNFIRKLNKKSANMSQDFEKLLKQLAPPLTNDKHKGQAGRIGVFGGSLEYTGAPYFASITSLKVGADLSHVFCAREAAPVIKSYSPELIVHPLLDSPDAASRIEPWLDRLHVILIGPGLGRDADTFKVIDQVIELCRVRNKPLVVDADGLFYISNNPQILKNYPSPVILTPNIMEFQRLVSSPDCSQNMQKQASNFLQLAPNITFLCKGHEDIIFNRSTSVKVTGGGSGRRCGGQGDLLSGATTTFLCWALRNGEFRENQSVIAAYAACKLTRRCNERAFGRLGRSMTCTDMIEEIHGAFEEFFEHK